MMGVIEQAAKRLQELRRSGIASSSDATTSREGLAEQLDVANKTPSSPSRNPEVRGLKPLRQSNVEEQHASSSEPQAGVGSRGGERVEFNLARLAATGIVTPDAPRSQLADEFRVIKRPLLENASRKGAGAIKNGNLIIVTSALPVEGKSFTAANLAMSIAMEMDRTVLLVDADVARPSLPGMLGLPPSRGLLDLLVDDSADLSHVLVKTSIETLSILSSGTQHPRATELLASEAMTQLLEEMAQRYADRLIIFDSPPLLVTTEARVLASHMGQVVLVVQAERTAQSEVMHALETIASCPVKLMILNQGRSGASDGYGYGYYGYGHGHQRFVA